MWSVAVCHCTETVQCNGGMIWTFLELQPVCVSVHSSQRPLYNIVDSSISTIYSVYNEFIYGSSLEALSYFSDNFFSSSPEDTPLLLPNLTVTRTLLLTLRELHVTRRSSWQFQIEFDTS